MTTVAFDLDGTLVDGDVDDWTDPTHLQDACEPIPEMVALVRSLADQGHEIHIVTARSFSVGHATTQQLRDLELPVDELWMNGEWQGYDHAAQRKAEQLEGIEPVVFVGDSELDETAAEIAGVPFLHVDHARLTLQVLTGTAPVHKQVSDHA